MKKEHNFERNDHAINSKEKKKGLISMVKKTTPSTHPYQDAMKQLLTQDGILALFIEDQYLSEEEKVLALEAIRHRLAQVVNQDGVLLGLFKPKYQTYELCWHAVSNNGLALQSVREDLMTIELCLEAMKQNPHAFAYVPEAFQTSEMCLQAIQTDISFIERVRKDFMTFEFCLEAMQHNPMVLSYLKDHFEIPSITLEAKPQPIAPTPPVDHSMESPENVYPMESNQAEAI